MQIPPPPATTRNITFETNFIGKLCLSEFLHIARAPAQQITESELEQQRIQIRTSDNSHDPVDVTLTDFLRIPIHMINDHLAKKSHGISAFELQCKFLVENPSFTTNTMIAIYFYKRL